LAVHTVVAILIAVGEVSSPMTQGMTDAMTSAVVEALGPQTSLVLRSTSTPSDDEALAIERQVDAAAVARVVWDGADQTVGVLRVHLRSTDRWFERRVTFSPGDSRAERGRTLGFAYASLLLGEQQPDPPAVAPAPLATAAPRAGPSAPEVTTAVNKASPPVVPAAAPPRDRALAIELAALAATGIGGPARSLGASLHAEWAVHGSFFARAGAALRIGRVPGLDGEDTLGGLGAGLAFRPRIPQPGKTDLGLGLTLEALGLYQDLSHRGPSGSTLHEGRLMGGVTGNVEASFRLSQALDLFGALGAEVVFDSTEVSVAGRTVATLPFVRPTAQAGLRWHD